LFADITTRNVGKRIAIFLDGQILSAPTVNTPITDGQAIITGQFTVQSAKDLVTRLNAGALPVPIKLVQQENVGATLGLQSVRKSVGAGLIGFAIVALFMIIYYRLPGVLAVIALSIYTALSLAIFKLFGITLTLAGIAGFILSIGMAVDANILIFERTKEELRKGKTLALAVEDGFNRAWLSVRDSNFSSLITTFILGYFGSSIIRGFAITLALGIIVSMFTAITVTRTFLRMLVGHNLLVKHGLYGVRTMAEEKSDAQ
jgi:preprotein translocase subunit SecD